MKRLTLRFMAFILILSAFLMLASGCKAEPKRIETISDFKRFDTLASEAERIKVTFDNNSGVPYYFDIIGEEQLREVMDIILSTPLENLGDEGAYAMDNTSLKIIQGGKEYTLHFHINREGQNFYAFKNALLQNKIRALESGIGKASVAAIKDNSDGYDLPAAFEEFYSDESYSYCFGYIMSEHIEVEYTNGTARSVSDALLSGHITISDLDKHGIDYQRVPKS